MFGGQRKTPRFDEPGPAQIAAAPLGLTGRA
jgi:hypothetical protein